jgi:hypothetical protein
MQEQSGLISSRAFCFGATLTSKLQRLGSNVRSQNARVPVSPVRFLCYWVKFKADVVLWRFSPGLRVGSEERLSFILVSYSISLEYCICKRGQLR